LRKLNAIKIIFIAAAAAAAAGAHKLEKLSGKTISL